MFVFQAMTVVCTWMFTLLSSYVTVEYDHSTFQLGNRDKERVVIPDCVDCVQVNSTIRVKEFGNYVFPEPDCHRKMLVYECLEDGVCGGLADRQKGIMSAFLLALLTNRTFVLNHRKACSLKTVIFPRIYNWFKCMPYITWYKYRGQKTLTFIDGKGNLPKNFSVLPPGDIWKEHLVVVHLNTRLNQMIKEHTDARKLIPWLFTASDREVVCALMKVLFRPVDHLKNHVDTFVRNHTSGGQKLLVGVHIRTLFLQNDRDLQRFFHFLSRFNDSFNFAVYIATDDPSVRTEAAKRLTNFVSTNATIVHIDNVEKDCDGMHTAVFEQQVLARADILVLSHSGFSRLAAYIRNKSANIFLYQPKTNVVQAHFEPIQLDDLVNMYPTS